MFGPVASAAERVGPEATLEQSIVPAGQRTDLALAKRPLAVAGQAERRLMPRLPDPQGQKRTLEIEATAGETRDRPSPTRALTE